MTDQTTVEPAGNDDELQRSITGRLLFFYVLGDVLGSGIYALIGFEVTPATVIASATAFASVGFGAGTADGD